MENIKIKKAPIVKCELDNKEQPKYIKDFIETMKHKDLSVFYNTLKTLTIEEADKEDLLCDLDAAEYNIETNNIRCSRKVMLDNIMHELIHAATRIEADDRIYFGFAQTTKDGTIGVGMTEGYTAYLDDKYFMDYTEHKRERSASIYPGTKTIVELLEALIGPDELEDYFFKSDLYGLAKELSSYSSPRKTYKFIQNLDTLYGAVDFGRRPKIIKGTKAFEDALLFIAECYTYKFNEMKKNGRIDENTYNLCMLYVNHILNRRMIIAKVIKSRNLLKYKNKIEDYVIKKVG